MKALEFLYQDTEIHFLVNPKNDNVMVNATEMAQAFNKRISDFTRLESTKKFIATFLEREKRKVIVADVQQYPHKKKLLVNAITCKKDIICTSKRSGTKMHRKLAIKFAAWLDVDFEHWIMDTIDDLLFSKPRIVKEAVIRKEEKERELEALILKANKTNNKTALEILQVKKDLKKLHYLQGKVVKDLTDQYKMDL